MYKHWVPGKARRCAGEFFGLHFGELHCPAVMAPALLHRRPALPVSRL